LPLRRLSGNHQRGQDRRAQAQGIGVGPPSLDYLKAPAAACIYGD
jgi:hypothetical protein